MEAEQIIQATCPECRGPLTKKAYDGVHEYECLVGHKYSARALLKAHSETQERTLWSAVVALEESKVLVEAVTGDLPSETIAHLTVQAEVKRQQAAEIRNILQQLEPFSLDEGTGPPMH